MPEDYTCPFCGQHRINKKRMDFHLKYGHADLYPLMTDRVTKIDLKKKLADLKDQRSQIDREIEIIEIILDRTQKQVTENI